ncbi:MAG: glycosyltransferase family A protein [Microthrixaceae bacterium]
MVATVDLLVWGSWKHDWQKGSVTELSTLFSHAAAQIDEAVLDTKADWLLFWDPQLGIPDAALLSELMGSRADAWHAGLCYGLSGQPEEHDYIHPIWPLVLDADPDIDSVSWRLSLSALLIKTDVLRTLGCLDIAFEHRTGAGLELGRRMIDRGAVVMHTPRLVAGRKGLATQLSEHDRFVFLRRVFGRKWVRYAAVRRSMAHRRPLKVRAALSSSAASTSASPRPGSDMQVVTRDAVNSPEDPAITVVLPTLGRYELLRPVLEQLRKQTLPAQQVVVVDQNDIEKRDSSIYEEFSDLNLEVIFQEEKGQWLARNAAVERAAGEWIAFVDDDSEVGPDFLEQHLEGLHRYNADLSTGASLAVIGAPIPESYAYFRVADQWDSGNGMCHRSLFERFGLFDQQFDRQRRGDAEFGLRVQLGGCLVIHNPHAIRVHLKAQEGGLRTFGSLDGFRHRDRTSPLPLPSMVYYTKRYHSKRQVREDLIIGLSQAIVPYELKRRASPRQWLGFVAAEVVHLPSTVKRVRASLQIADEMVEVGPRIPKL